MIARNHFQSFLCMFALARSHTRLSIRQATRTITHGWRSANLSNFFFILLFCLALFCFAINSVYILSQKCFSLRFPWIEHIRWMQNVYFSSLSIQISKRQDNASAICANQCMQQYASHALFDDWKRLQLTNNTRRWWDSVRRVFFFIFLFFVLQGHAKLIHLNVLFTVLRYHSTHKTWTKNNVFFSLFFASRIEIWNLKSKLGKYATCVIDELRNTMLSHFSIRQKTKKKVSIFCADKIYSIDNNLAVTMPANEFVRFTAGQSSNRTRFACNPFDIRLSTRWALEKRTRNEFNMPAWESEEQWREIDERTMRKRRKYSA